MASAKKIRKTSTSRDAREAAFGTVPSITLPSGWTNGMIVPEAITDTTVTLVYTSNTTITSGTVQITVDTFSNCYLWKKGDPPDPTALSATAPVVPDQTDQTKGTATFRMAVTGAVGAACGFAAHANDSGQTALNPSFTGNITAINPVSAFFGINALFVPTWDGTDPRPTVPATATATGDNGQAFQGMDVLVIGRGFADTDSAFGRYVDVYDATGQTKLDTETITFDNQSYQAVRIYIDNSFGSVGLTLEPIAQKQGYVTLVGIFGNVSQQSAGVFILNPKADTTHLLSASPTIDKLNGMCLEPGQTDVDATIWTPVAAGSNVSCYGLINYVSAQGPSILAAKLNDDNLEIEQHDGIPQVKWQVPLASLNLCQTQSNDHLCENCKPPDLNGLSYMYFEAVNNTASYSLEKSCYLDIFIGNEPPPVTATYAAPQVFAGKYVNGNLVADGQPIPPGTFITLNTILNGGLVVRLQDPAIVGKLVQGEVYLNGLNTDKTEEHAATPKRVHFALLQSPQTVPSNPGYLDVPLYARQVGGFDYAGNLMEDAGFFVIYWDVLNGNPDAYSQTLHRPLNTAYAY